MELLQARANQITFTSSLISWLPMFELVGLSFLLRWSSLRQEQVEPKYETLPFIKSTVDDHE
jgi:hypothetical protein